MQGRGFRTRQIFVLSMLPIAALAFLTLLFKHISYPLLWYDEADTVMFGQRVLEYGYPKIHGAKNVLAPAAAIEAAGFEAPRAGEGGDESDAFRGAPWGYYCFATIGIVLARGVDDLYAKTALLRIPFAIIGALGLLILLIGLLAAVEPRSRAAYSFWYCVLASYSVSLLLHLREARYYGIVVFLSAALITVYLHRIVFERLGFRAYVVLTTILLVLLFNTFYPAYPVFLVAMGLHLIGRVVTRPWSIRERIHCLIRDACPLFLSLVGTIPLLFYFDFLSNVGSWVNDAGASYGSHLAIALANLLRYEFLAPALVARAAVYWFTKQEDIDTSSETVRRRSQATSFLLVFFITYWLMVSRSPSIWERYFVALSPVLIAMFLLDALALSRMLKSRPRTRGRITICVVVATVFLSTGWLRFPDFVGRLHEINHRYRGPLDFVIPYLKQTYENVEDLVIATNYEGPSFMYYLGSRVTVGYYGANLEEDLSIQPDIIVPRWWDRNLDTLEMLAARDRYRMRPFPIRNLMTNNVPGLSHLSPGGLTHEFKTRLPAAGEELVILERY